MTDIDWGELRRKANEQTTKAYAPYSNFRVGAAAVTAGGRIVTGCNVENASYGLTLCAECSMVSSLYSDADSEEDHHLVAISVVDAEGKPCAPCGRCRQILSEHSTTDTLIETGSGIRPLAELLPEAFGPADL